MPEKRIDKERGCCVGGKWGYPSNETPQEWLSWYEIAEMYLQEREGSGATLDEHRPYTYTFIPKNQKRYRGVEQDNIPGTFTLVYTTPE